MATQRTNKASRTETDRRKRRGAIDTKFRERHPTVAKAESRLRQARRTRERNYAGRDMLQDGGTPETREKAARVHQGSIARLYERGYITIDQLAGAQQIRAIAARLGRDVAISSGFSMASRVDQSRSGTGAFFEALGAVRAEVAYRRWSAELGRVKGRASVAAAVILDDEAVRRAAQRRGMRDAKLRRLLGEALDLWSELLGEACQAIDEADVLAMHAGLI